MKENFGRYWSLDPDRIFLNHGSFGACPTAVLEYQSELRAQMERRPTHFFAREVMGLLEATGVRVAEFLGAEPAGLAALGNASTGVNTVLRSLAFEPGDEILVTDHEYGPCRDALRLVAERSRATVVVAELPFPVESAEGLVAPIVEAVTARTKLLLVDHVTSQTGLVMPLAEIVAAMNANGVDTLVDGAHGPGMLPLDLEGLGVSYYAGNCHKWLCGPKGAGFLYVRADRRDRIRPLVMGHAGVRGDDEPGRFAAEFAWQGTFDPTAWLSVPAVIDHLGGLLPDGWEGIYRRNHELAVEGRRIVAEALGVGLPCPDELVGSMFSLPLPDGEAEEEATGAGPGLDPLEVALWEEHGIEATVKRWPDGGGRLLRVSAQLYNTRADFEALAAALAPPCGWNARM